MAGNLNGITVSTGAGSYPLGIACDGADLFRVANNDTNTVSKIVAASGVVVGSYAAGSGPIAAVFDGTNVWVADQGGTVVKLTAATGALVGTYTVGNTPALSPTTGRTSGW